MMKPLGTPEGFDPLGETAVDLRLKQIKCSTCKCKIEYNHETIALCIETCKYRDRVDHMACGIKQLNDFITRMKERNNGKPKKLPVLFQPQKVNEEILEDLARKGVPDWRRKEILHQVETKTAPANEEAEPSELEFPDPIRIFISKHGIVSEQKLS